MSAPGGIRTPPSCFVGKRSYPLCYGRMVVTEGIEPPASRSSGGRSTAALSDHGETYGTRTRDLLLDGQVL